MARIITDDSSIIFTMRDEIVRVEAYRENCIRVRATRNNTFSEERWTLNDPAPANAIIKSDGESASIETGVLKAVISKAWKTYDLVFYINGKEVLRKAEETDAVTRYSHIEGDNYRIRALFASRRDEHFYGLGQEQQDWFDRKGGSYELIHYNTKSVIPFLYSSLGYGFLWNCPSTGKCETVKNHTLWQADSAYQADFLVLGGEKPADISKLYCQLTGFPPKLPDWAAGFWQCKLRYESQDDLLEVAREYKKRNIPIDAIIIDYFHWTEQGEWEFEPSLWPDPAEMCRELDEMGIRPIVSVWPTINPDSKYYEEMNDRNMLVRTENGLFGTFEFYGPQTFIDPTNPETREFVWDKIKKNYFDKGIKTYWLDEAEPEVHPQQFDNLRFYKGNGAQTALLYPYYYSQCFYDGMKASGEEEIALLTRAAFTGSQRFGAIVWNGDIWSKFESLRQSVVSGLSMAMCGISRWNSDIGGFWGADIESDYFKELIVRWFQFGLFSPVMRLHGSRQRTKNQVDRHPGVKERSGGDNEIWSFGERDYEIIKKLIELRYRLKPYIIRHSNETCENGVPIMRPMFYDFYEDENCYAIDDQYMFGPDILFAPIMAEGQTEREVYLPAGKWVRTTDGSVHEGGGYIKCTAQLDEFIAFVKEGAEILKAFEI